MNCPLCESRKNSPVWILTQEKKKSREYATLLKCRDCGLLFAPDFTADRSHIYRDSYWVWEADSGESGKLVKEAKKTAFAGQMASLNKYINPEGKKLLDVGTGFGYLLDVAAKTGFDCWGVDISRVAAETAQEKFPGKIACGDLMSANYPSGFFDVISMVDVLEHITEPHKLIVEAKRILKSGGFLFIISPNSSSITRLLAGRNWFQYKYEHILFFNRKSLKLLLEKHGFELLEFKLNIKRFNLAYYEAYFQKYSFFGFEKIFNLFFPLLPNFVKNKYFSNPCTGEFLAVAKKRKKIIP
jgi:SAM-dependent methyltransferase